MTDGLVFKILVEFSLIFKEEKKDLKAYLIGIKRTDLLNAATFFLGLSNRDSRFQDFKEFLKMFFCSENYQFANDIYFKLKSIRERQNVELNIISPLTALQLFEFSFEHLSDQETQSKAEAEINIFKAILFINEENSSIQNLANETTKSINPEIKLAALTLSQSFAYSDLINYDQTEVLVGQVIKSIYLFEFLERNSNTKILLKSFLKYFNSADWKDFLRSILPLVFSIVETQTEAHLDIKVELGENFEKNCEFIESLMISDTEEINDYDFIKIRSKPFYKVKQGVYRIIFSLFVIELIHKGLFFKLSEINKTLDKSKKVKGNFRGFYCDEFSEKFLFYKLLNSIYQNRYIEFNGSEIKAHNIVAEPDYYIRNGNKVFLFESKDILINAKIKPTCNFNKYESEFKKKLYFERKDNKMKNKAVLQLINNIERILKKKLSIDTNYKPNSIYIYPIIVLHDQQFNILGLNFLVNNWYNYELNKLKKMGLKIDRVRPITIINIDTLIFHQDLFRNRILKLENIIEDYFTHITFNKKKKYRNEEHKKQFVKRTLEPFSIFLTNYVNDKRIQRVPKMLREKGINLFD